MSGICGLFNLDHASVTEQDIGSACAMLEQRGPHATNLWCDGAVGLGHTLLSTTPELQFERQPFAHPETDCVITADVRLDNRDELLNHLVPDRRPDSIGDAELILLAYLRWDENCLDRLLGDFAFVVWDPRQQKMFCGRDHFGMRPLYYHHAPGRRFVFGSSTRSILVLPQVPYCINEGRVADYLVSELEWIDYTSTFFEGIFRLPPGHKAIITQAGLNIAEYWHPSPGPDPGPMSDDDYREGFLEVFTRAVEARLRAPIGTVGSMLSGGMDSGSVVAVAKEILRQRGEPALPTFSAVSDQRDISTDLECGESQAIYASIALPNIHPTLIEPLAAAQDTEMMLSDYEEPFDTGFMFLKAIYQAASDQGVRVLLDGGGGDMVLAENSYVVRLLQQWKLKRALAEILAENKLYGGGVLFSTLFRYTRAAVVPELIKKPLRRIKSSQREKTYLGASLISNDLAERVDIASHFEQNRRTFPSDRPADYASESVRVIRPNMTAGRERYARIAAITATEARDPFLDKRVVEFCSHLPGHLRLRDGTHKIILKEVMNGRVPNEVAWTGRKHHVGWRFNQAVKMQLLAHGTQNIDELRENLGDLIDSVALGEAWQTFADTGYSENLNSAIYLSRWLRENTRRPVVPD